VTQFHEDLTKRIKVRLGADNVRLWRDIEIRNNDEFTKKIMGRLSKTAALLGVLSPSFLKREWTLRELETFVRHATSGPGLLIKAEKSRIFKVEKINVPRDALPAPMRGTKSYKFYKNDANRELRPYLDADRSSYLQQLDDLAIDIANLLKDMEQPDSSPDRLAVYVAETSSDLDDQLRSIRRELTDWGYLVLPEGDLSHRADEYVPQVRENVQQAVLSVHLVGAKYGLVPEGETRSIIAIQHDLAMERGSPSEFARLIWMPPGLQSADERQQKFIEYLENDAAVQASCDLMVTKLDDLKTSLHDKLAEIKRAIDSKRQVAAANVVNAEVASTDAAVPSDAASGSDEPPTIYVICDNLDLRSRQLLDLRNYLLDQGYEPVLPRVGNLQDLSLTRHLENLKACDAFLIFYGEGSPEWLDDKLSDYRQYLRGRQRRVWAKAVYVTPPETPHKHELRTNEAMVLRGRSEFSPDDVDALLKRLRQGSS
jgi:antitoxin component HigA of HigAB toxin-antitoxin module